MSTLPTRLLLASGLVLVPVAHAAPKPAATKAHEPTTPAGSKPLRKVTVALDWTPNTNHTGLYVAKARGAFAARGLEVSFLQPAQTTSTALTAAGKADFAVSFTSDIIQARAEKLPVKSIAAIVQHNTSCFAWREDSGIRSLKDWEGKRYGGWGSPEETATIRYLLKAKGADPENVRMVVSGVSDFLATTPRNADVMWIYMGWDALRAKLAGVRIVTACPGDLDPVFDHHSPLLATGEAMAAKDPGVVRDFLAATSEGYALAIAEPAKAADMLLAEVPELDAALVKASVSYLAGEYARGAPRWGEQKADVWARSLAWNRAQGLSRGKEPAAAHFTNAFLPAAGNPK